MSCEVCSVDGEIRSIRSQRGLVMTYGLFLELAFWGCVS